MDMDVRFDTYYCYDDLTEKLKVYADSYSDLCRLYSLGQSPEGRELWMMEITNFAEGTPGDRPGIYIDGNHHAGEVTSSMACLYTIHHLLTGYGDDPEIQRLLDTTIFYIRPRVSPDGAEVYLTTPQTLRSVPRPYPDIEMEPGLYPEDIDGDGWITQMRIEDPNGDWQVSESDPRIMVGRDEDGEGPYYNLCPEGRISGDLSGSLKVAPHPWGLDLNRNYPANWQPEHVQKGGGPYPLSEPETRVNADFILSHPNIGMIVSYHTSGHFVFRPPSSRPASDFSTFDIDTVYGVLGAKYTEIVDGPVRQSYDEKTGSARIGSLMDWAFQHLGIVAWVPELWAWGKDYDGDGEISEEDRMRWNDEELDSEGFADWREFEHPQLGRVEIGGWKTKFTRQNPPGPMLEEEIRPHYQWSLYLARSLPRIEIADVGVEMLRDGIFRVTAVVQNAGLLPTNITDQAVRTGRARPVRVAIDVEAGEVLHGEVEREVGHLEGRIMKHAGGSGPRYSGSIGPAKAIASWVVAAEHGNVSVRVTSEKGGTDARSVRVAGV